MTVAMNLKTYKNSEFRIHNTARQQEAYNHDLQEPAIVKGDQHTITANTTAEESTYFEYMNLCDITVFLGLDDLNS